IARNSPHRVDSLRSMSLASPANLCITNAEADLPPGLRGHPMTRIESVEVHDVRFPTAAAGDGSDAINRGDYSATYVELHTDGPPPGAGFPFTNGRGNEITCAAVRALARHVTGRSLADLSSDPAAFVRSLTADVQLRWLG